MIGNISSIETMGLVDGPGIRVVVFMKGCNLRCKFCHNPETWWTKEKEVWSSNELIEYVLKYKDYFKNNGGITFSGGEPLFQPDFLLECLKLCKENDIHTCIETSGVGEDYEQILDYTDLVIFDIKDINEVSYQEMTGKDIKFSLKFLNSCQKKNKKIWIRQIIIPTKNDSLEYILLLKEYIKKFNNIEKIELIPYHTMGISKYKEYNIPYLLEGIPDMDKEELKKLEKLLLN